MAKQLLAWLNLLVLLILIPGCSSDSAKHEIEKVIKADQRLAEIRDDEANKIGPSKAIVRYSDSMKRIDLSKCPFEFREAYIAHANSWARSASIAEKYEGLGGAITAFMNDFIHGASMGKIGKTTEHEMRPYQEEINRT